MRALMMTKAMVQKSQKKKMTLIVSQAKLLAAIESEIKHNPIITETSHLEGTTMISTWQEKKVEMMILSHYLVSQ